MKQIRKLFRTYQGLALSVLILLGVVAGVIWGIIPAVLKINVLRSEASVLSKQNELLRVKANILDNVDQDQYKKYLAELASAVPADKSLTSVFSTIDGLGLATGVALSDFTVKKPGVIASESAARQSTEEKQIGSSLLPFSLTVTGSYDQIRNFITQAIAVRRFFRIRYFDISLESLDVVSARMGMDAFYAPFPTNLGSADQQIDGLSQKDEEIIGRVSAMTVLSQDVSVPDSGQNAPAPSASSREDLFSP